MSQENVELVRVVRANNRGALTAVFAAYGTLFQAAPLPQ